MTYIEFFDKIASENVCACLTYTPDRVIYIGDTAKVIKKHIERYETVFSERGKKIEFLYKIVVKDKLDEVVRMLTEIVETYDDCVFGVTGGEEIFVLALGMVYGRYPEKNIQIHKFNLKNNVVYDCDKDGNTIYKDTPKLSIEENVKIYGGDVVYGDINDDNTYVWDLNQEFVHDVDTIWKISKCQTKTWNAQITFFGAIEGSGNIDCNNPLKTIVNRKVLECYLDGHKIKYRRSKNIIDNLLKSGLLTCFYDCDNDETIVIEYKNEQIKKCLTKAGQALEMKIFLAAKNLRDDKGDFVYNDAMNGVVIDWDGEFHDENVENEYDTENEIDVMLMHGVVPVFISCKNGMFTADELYKLNTVAERFGGPYSKKVLVTTYIEKMGALGEYLKQRAKDMNIKLIDGVHNLEDAELEKHLSSLWRV